MKRATTVAILAICVAGTALVLVSSMWFHGYFDPGKFEIKQARWYFSKQVAIVAERTDQQALGGLTYFVLIENHLFTPTELRHAYHSSATIFAAPSDCIDLRWEREDKLVITCGGSTIEPGFIDVQKQKSGNISILYENIPIKNPK